MPSWLPSRASSSPLFNDKIVRRADPAIRTAADHASRTAEPSSHATELIWMAPRILTRLPRQTQVFQTGRILTHHCHISINVAGEFGQIGQGPSRSHLVQGCKTVWGEEEEAQWLRVENR
jgi:hypothetical protein